MEQNFTSEYKLFLPNAILNDKNLNDIQTNILFFMYFYCGADYICKYSSDEIAEELGLKNRQEFIRWIKLMPQYIETIGHGRQTWYILKIKANFDYSKLESQLYRQFKKQASLIVNYFKFQYKYKLMRGLVANGEIDELCEFQHAKLMGMPYKQYAQIKFDLFNNGLIQTSGIITFLREPDYERQIKIFEMNYCEKQKLKLTEDN